MEKEKKKKKVNIWFCIAMILLSCLIVGYMSWNNGFSDGFKSGWKMSYNTHFPLIVNETTQYLTEEHFNKCVKYLCESFLNSSYENGKCEKEELTYASVNMCYNIIKGSDE